MAGRDITIPFGPDRTSELPLEALPPEGEGDQFIDPLGDPFDQPQQGFSAATLPDPAQAPSIVPETDYQVPDIVPETDYKVPDLPSVTAAGTPEAADPYQTPARESDEPRSSSGPALSDATAAAGAIGAATIVGPRTEPAPASSLQASQATGAADDADYHPGGISDEDATAQGMDEMQMSILALKDSIGQGRELKEREKERKALAEALEADHVELADRENILNNYQSLVAEQDAIIADRTQRRDAAKDEISQLTIAVEQTQAQLEGLREQHAQQLQPLETDLGRARAAADQAKNDERSRKSELNAAESELRKASDADVNIMAVARHQQVKGAYDEARERSEQAKEQLAQVQRAYDEAKQRAEQAQGPLERNIEDYKRRIDALKEDINTLGDELSAARNRRQYCDTVYQYPDETAKMRSEIEQAEALASKMDAENERLREQLAQSKQKARKAKLAIAAIILIIVVFIVSFIVLSGR